MSLAPAVLVADVFIRVGVLLGILMILGLMLLVRGGTGATVAVTRNSPAVDRRHPRPTL